MEILNPQLMNSSFKQNHQSCNANGAASIFRLNKFEYVCLSRLHLNKYEGSHLLTRRNPSPSDRKFVCRVDKKEAARRALEDALGGNKDKWNRWNEEISSREGNGGNGGKGGQGGGGGGGGNWDGWEKGGRNWLEIKEASLAIGIILSLFFFLTQGSKIVALTLNSIAFVLRGFKTSEGANPVNNKITVGKNETKVTGTADRVSKKWGSD